MANAAAKRARKDLRLDPFALPIRYSAPLPGPASATAASVYLDRAKVVVKRTLGGIPATLSYPVSAFRGVAVRMKVEPETGDVSAVIELMHRDPCMTLPLAVAGDLGDAEDVAADWQAWGKALGLPLLIVEGDGTVREALSQLGGLVVNPVKARRIVSSLSRRRPRFLKRRKTGIQGETELLTGREIIARD
ncbi:DUF6101 family protein [Kaistia dalseonensis]|uniref:Transposase n=1 Tax=Kaistia dalseonensis TaxID=410840 RepID=A0ABU0HEV2_9HYPH|nr:DUF6101 family protein [Kaistia dalseonensis]MCX5497371.1 DUF6101 family protein [Kaistia dalseonensis]MDQ0440009.1 hypothetical protein [Kaistia dalseonensis]